MLVVLAYTAVLGSLAAGGIIYLLWHVSDYRLDYRWLLSYLLIVAPLPLLLHTAMRRWTRRVNEQLRHLSEANETSRALQQQQTLQLQTEMALRESDRQFRAVWHSASDALMLVDNERRLVDANPAACTLFGKSRTAVGAAPIDVFLTAPSAAAIVEDWPRMLTSGEHHGELIVTVADGEHVVEFSFTAEVIPGKHLFIWRDVSERKRLEFQLRQSQKMETVGRLAGGVAHDFNNLLTVIIGNAGIALEECDGLAKEAVNEVLGAGERAVNLTRQLLAFSRKQVLQASVVNLNTILTEMERMMPRLINEAIQLRTTLAPDLWAVKVDSTQMEQVIINLVVNARDAMPIGGQLLIETSNVEVAPGTRGRRATDLPEGSYVRLAVTDTGIGMDEATRAQIFEPFFTTKEGEKGTGLGLATVYGIVRQSGGQVMVESQPGHGSTFSLYFPRVEQPVHQRAGREEPATSPAGSETILLVEDEDAVRTLARHVLERCGYRVLVATCGEEGCRIAADSHIDLLLTDVVMPRMNGKELAAVLRSRRGHLKVVFMSGYTEEAVLQATTNDSVFLPKPFTSSELASAVRGLLDSRAPAPTAIAGR
jgi:two-component system, cell cycle sensor histidine kinase and response regulator CckA